MSDKIPIKTERELGLMETAGRMVGETLEALRLMAADGLTTMDLEQRACAMIKEMGGIPAFKGYRGYPACLCTSVNSQVIHGIPSPEVRLHHGDIVGIDLGVNYRGYFADAALTVAVGVVSPEAARLMRATSEALHLAIGQAREGNRVGDIGHAVQRYVEAQGYSVVKVFVGHGIGRSLHEEPQVPNYGLPGKGPVLKSGMTLAIEPMVNAGGSDVVVLRDGWTAVTADGSLSAHYEHTVLVTPTGGRILTGPGSKSRPA